MFQSDFFVSLTVLRPIRPLLGLQELVWTSDQLARSAQPPVAHAASSSRLDQLLLPTHPLRDFLTAGSQRVTKARGRRPNVCVRSCIPSTGWLSGRPAVGAEEEKVRPAKLELRPMDWRNPPSENIAQTALPLAVTAAAATAAIYFAASAGSPRPRHGRGRFDSAWGRLRHDTARDSCRDARPGTGGCRRQSRGATPAGIEPGPCGRAGGGRRRGGRGRRRRGQYSAPVPRRRVRSGRPEGWRRWCRLDDGHRYRPGSSGGSFNTIDNDNPPVSGISFRNAPTGTSQNLYANLGGADKRGGDAPASGIPDVSAGADVTRGGGVATNAANGGSGSGGSTPGQPQGDSPSDRPMKLFESSIQAVRFVANAGQWGDGTDFRASRRQLRDLH